MLFAVGKRREYFYRIEMSMTPPLRYATGTGRSLIASPIRFASGTGGESVHLDLLTIFLRGFSRSPAVRGCKLPSTPSGVSPRDPRVEFRRYSYRCNGVWGVPKRGTGEAPGMDNIYFYQCRQASEPKASGVIVDIDFNKK